MSDYESSVDSAYDEAAASRPSGPGQTSHEDEPPPPPESPESPADEAAEELGHFVRKFVELDDDIRALKADIKPTTQRIKELSLQKRQVATVVARLMANSDVDTLQPTGPDGTTICKLTRVMTNRVQPTVAAFKTAVLTELLGGDEGRLKALQEKALTLCKPPVPTLRRSGGTRKKASNIDA